MAILREIYNNLDLIPLDEDERAYAQHCMEKSGSCNGVDVVVQKRKAVPLEGVCTPCRNAGSIILSPLKIWKVMIFTPTITSSSCRVINYFTWHRRTASI